MHDKPDATEHVQLCVALIQEGPQFSQNVVVIITQYPALFVRWLAKIRRQFCAIWESRPGKMITQQDTESLCDIHDPMNSQ